MESLITTIFVLYKKKQLLYLFLSRYYNF